jgi:hypothetical protein
MTEQRVSDERLAEKRCCLRCGTAFIPKPHAQHQKFCRAACRSVYGQSARGWESRKQRQERWSKSEAGRASGRKHAAKRHSQHPEQASARRRVDVAVRAGRLLVPKSCEGCGEMERRHPRRNLQAHHDDYSKPLEVRWLCQKCHVAIHAA